MKTAIHALSMGVRDCNR